MRPHAFKVRIVQEALQCARGVTIPVGNFCITIFAGISVPQFLVPLGCHVNVEIVEGFFFYLVGVLVALPVVAPQAKDTGRLWRLHAEDNRKVQRIETAFPNNCPKFVLCLPGYL